MSKKLEYYYDCIVDKNIVAYFNVLPEGHKTLISQLF
jgi:hypothetical protein